jgi:AsmA protein
MRNALAYAGLGLLVLVTACATFLIVAPPTELVRDKIVAEVKARTGRELIVAGPASFTVLPSPGIKLRDVSLAAGSGSDEPVLRLTSLKANVALLPLLQRRVALERLVLHDPVLDLRIDADGRRNWERAEAELQPVRVAQAAHAVASDAPAAPTGSALSPSRERVLARLQHLDLGEVLIENGTVHYRDGRSGGAHIVEGINARLGVNGISRPLDIEASLAWRGERIEIDGRLTAPEDVVAGHPARLALGLAGEHGTASFDGALSLPGRLSVEGALKGETRSVRALARWLGARLPAASGFGPATLEGSLAADGSSARLTDASLTVDGATATGTLAVDLSATRPLVMAELQASELNLNTYLAQDASRDERPVRSAPHAGAPKADRAAPKSIEDLLGGGKSEPPGPRVKGFARRGGWSEAQFDPGDLARIDLDARLGLGSLRFRNMRADAGTLVVALRQSVLNASFEDFQIYGGRGRAVIGIDGRSDEPVIEIKAKTEGVSMQPLLEDLAATDWVSGTGNVTLAVSGKGRSERALVETLSGKGSFTVANGVLAGWSLPHTIGALRRGRLGTPEKGAAGTEFGELAGTVTIESGVAHNQDLRLLTPLARVTGTGTVSLAERQIDYVLRPKLASSAEAQNGSQQTAGLEVPIRIQGSWEEPHVTADLSGVVQNPGQAWEAVKGVGKHLKGKKVEEVVKGILGDEPGQSDKAKQLLNQLLKRQ